MKKLKSLFIIGVIALTVSACEPNVGVNEERNADLSTTQNTESIIDSGISSNSGVINGSEENTNIGGDLGSGNAVISSENSDVSGISDITGDKTDISEVSSDSSVSNSTASETSNDNSNGNITSSENNNTASTTSMSVTNKELANKGTSFEVPLAITENLSTAKIGWGLGKEVDKNNRPIDAVNANKKYPNALFIGDSDKNIYLTFDEGYENGYTAQILDTLKEKQVKATFFVTYDYCKSAGDLVKRMIAEGHTIGNHSYTHPSFPDCSDREVQDELMKLHNYVRDNFGYEMKLARFPRGEFSEKTLAISKALGYQNVFWSFAHADWLVDNQPDPISTLQKIKDTTHPGEIALLHAVSSTNAQILPAVLDYWKSCGYHLDIPR